MKTTRERAEEERLSMLALVREQEQRASLVIGQMSAEEPRRCPPRPVGADNRGKR